MVKVHRSKLGDPLFKYGFSKQNNRFIIIFFKICLYQLRVFNIILFYLIFRGEICQSSLILGFKVWKWWFSRQSIFVLLLNKWAISLYSICQLLVFLKSKTLKSFCYILPRRVDRISFIVKVEVYIIEFVFCEILNFFKSVVYI